MKDKDLIDVSVLIAAMAFTVNAIINTWTFVLDHPKEGNGALVLLSVVCSIGACAIFYNLLYRHCHAEGRKGDE